MTEMNNPSGTARELSTGGAPTAATVPEAQAQPDRAGATAKEAEPQTAAMSGTAQGEPGHRSRFTPRTFVPLLVLLMAAAILFGIAGSWNARVGDQTNQKTDDATLRADITPLSTRVSGDVVKVAVEDYQRVKAGALLVQLNDNDYRAQVGQAEAVVRGAQAAIENNTRQKELQESRIEQARTGVEAARAEVEQAEAGIMAAQADRNNAQSGVDAAYAAVAAAQANVEGARAQIQGAQANVEGAKADVDAARANVESASADVAAAQTNIDGTAADVERTRLERGRQETLVSLGSATRQKLEQVVADNERFKAVLAGRQADLLHSKAALTSREAAFRQAETLLVSRQAALRQVQTLLVSYAAALRQARAQLEGRRSELAKARAQVALRQAALTQANAQLAGHGADLETQYRQRPVLDSQRAELMADLKGRQEALKVAQTNLDYTRILAPADGMVGERKVRVGQLVSPGTQAISLIQSNLWIQANYKETQLTHVRKGDAATATVDAFPGVVLRGHVEEIAPASGSQFALLPPDNATGNYTKIAQRIPVKIALDLDPAIAARLRPGMSVIAEIKTSGNRKN